MIILYIRDIQPVAMNCDNIGVQNSSPHPYSRIINAHVYNLSVSAWRMALFPQSWHLLWLLDCIYYIPYISFLTDAFHPFVTETKECHINLLFHYDNFVLFCFFRIQCSCMKTNSLSSDLWGVGEIMRNSDCHNYWMAHYNVFLVLVVLTLMCIINCKMNFS